MNTHVDNLFPPRIVDAHAHLWDLQRLSLPWVKPPLDRSFLLADYLAAARGLNITRAVYVEVGVDPSQRYDEADLAIDLARRRDTPIAGVVLRGDVASDDFFRYVENHPDRPCIKGIRQGLPDPLTADSPFVRGVRRLGDLNLTCDLHTDPDTALPLVRLCPDTRFVLNHFGVLRYDILASSQRTARWAGAIAAIADCPNVACKLSGVVATGPAGWDAAAALEYPVLHLLETFGPQRLMFGGDWPVCTRTSSLHQWTTLVARLLHHLPADACDAIFFETAVRWYALENPPP